MIYAVEMSEKSQNDLKEIIEYISSQLEMPLAAKKLYSEIKNCINSLSQMPERYKEYDKEKYKSYNLRMVSVNNYCVFYTVDNKNHNVYIVNIFYGKMDLEKHITIEQ